MKAVTRFAILALTIGAGIIILAEKAAMAEQDAIRLLVESRSPPLDGAKDWLNTTPLTASDLTNSMAAVRTEEDVLAAKVQ
jgi:hypothetical protein